MTQLVPNTISVKFARKNWEFAPPDRACCLPRCWLCLCTMETPGVVTGIKEALSHVHRAADPGRPVIAALVYDPSDHAQAACCDGVSALWREAGLRDAVASSILVPVHLTRSHGKDGAILLSMCACIRLQRHRCAAAASNAGGTWCAWAIWCTAYTLMVLCATLLQIQRRREAN